MTLASLHAAKGLEWDAVFLVGLTEGMLPITYAKTDETDRGGAPAALRRRHPGPPRHLTLSWALSRAPGGRPSRRPSRFLSGLRPGSTAPPPGHASRTPRVRWATSPYGSGSSGSGVAPATAPPPGRRAQTGAAARVCGAP
ncbi:hypothetical protein GCM10020221_35210 [Streptomyces thioluteus]|uniref:UvrD-like helicase C-terminal domain-containing protein n=1 Tax=Streptomyces thioluteus TaxID=66431 RepID=A0ABN3X642_STRTU